MIKKRKLGILGGMGSHAAAWLFQRIIQLSKAGNDQEYLEIIVHNNTAIPDRTQHIIYGGASPLKELQRSIRIFNENDIDVAVMACMTAHYYYDELAMLFEGELIHPVDFVIRELACNAACAGRMHVGLIGTTGLIKSGIFHSRLEPLGYEVITLNDEDQEKYFMEPLYGRKGIKAGGMNEEIKKLVVQQERILTDQGAQVILGACSEIPLVMNGCKTVPFIDVFQLLAERIVEYCYTEAIDIKI